MAQLTLQSAKVGEIWLLYINSNYLADFNLITNSTIEATIIADPAIYSDFLAGWKKNDTHPYNVKSTDIAYIQKYYANIIPNLHEYIYCMNVSHQRMTAGKVEVLNIVGIDYAIGVGCTCSCGYFNEYAIPNMPNGKYQCSQCKMFNSIFC